MGRPQVGQGVRPRVFRLGSTFTPQRRHSRNRAVGRFLGLPPAPEAPPVPAAPPPPPPPPPRRRPLRGAAGCPSVRVLPHSSTGVPNCQNGSSADKGLPFPRRSPAPLARFPLAPSSSGAPDVGGSLRRLPIGATSSSSSSSGSWPRTPGADETLSGNSLSGASGRALCPSPCVNTSSLTSSSANIRPGSRVDNPSRTAVGETASERWAVRAWLAHPRRRHAICRCEKEPKRGPRTLRQEAVAAPAAASDRLGPRRPLRHIKDMPRVSGTRSGAESTPGAGDPFLPERPRSIGSRSPHVPSRTARPGMCPARRRRRLPSPTCSRTEQQDNRTGPRCCARPAITLSGP